MALGKPVLAATIAAAALASSAVAAGTDPILARTPAGDAAAGAAVFTSGDVGSGFNGGLGKPDLSGPPNCPGYTPTEADLVVVGGARSTFDRPGYRYASQVQVLRTAAMVRTDWRRTFAPGFLACFRSQAAAGGGPGARLLSVEHLDPPRLAPHATEYQLMFEISPRGTRTRVLIDFIACAKGRTELSLTTTASDPAPAAVRSEALRLMRVMLARVHA